MAERLKIKNVEAMIPEVSEVSNEAKGLSRRRRGQCRGGRLDWGAVVFALLVVATLAAFAYAQRVKRDPLVVDRFTINGGKPNAFAPGSKCGKRRARLKFRTTTSNDGTVEIIRPGGEVVAKLARHQFLKRYTFHTFHWDGRNEDGAVRPPWALQAAGDPRRRRTQPHPSRDDPPAQGPEGRLLRCGGSAGEEEGRRLSAFLWGAGAATAAACAAAPYCCPPGVPARPRC